MMKIIKYLLLTILLIPVSVKAATDDLIVTCTPSEVNVGDSVSCSIKGTSDGDVGSLKFNINPGANMTITSFTKLGSWEGNLNATDNKVSLYNDDSITGTFDIGTLSLKVKDDAVVGATNISFSDIVFYADTDNSSANINNKEIPITITSSSSTVTEKGLESLRPTVGTFGVQFESTRDAYMLTLPGDATTFGFEAVAKDSNDSIVFLNADDSTNTPLSGNNITFATSGGNDAMLIHIEVGSGERKMTYSVSVQKEVNTTDKSYELSSLKVGDQTVSLVSGKYEYTVQLNDVTSYTVTADLKDRESYVITNLISPRTGDGPFTIVIEPKDNSSGLRGTIYTITVTKGSGGESSSSSSSSSSSTHPSGSTITNPQTGGALSIIIALILAASFGASIYFYKRNMGYFSKK